MQFTKSLWALFEAGYTKQQIMELLINNNMATSIEITGHIVKDPTKIGDLILLNVPMKDGDTLRINGWDITLPTKTDKQTEV